MKYKINHTLQVRYELMRGSQATEAIRKKRLGYLPIGCLERHNEHLPMGLDTLKAHGVCCLMARAFGGVVFPPHHYGGIHMMNKEQLDFYTGEWGNIYADASAYASLTDIIRQFERAGIKVLVLYSGHHPTCQQEMNKRIADEFNAKDGIKIIQLSENMVMDGDHAGLSETSFMLYLERELVDMTAISTGKEYGGGGGPHDPAKASVGEGERRAEMMLDRLATELEKYFP